MTREDQVILIMQIAQRQRRKQPTASDSTVYLDTYAVCQKLIKSEDFDEQIVEEALAIVFETARELLDKKREIEYEERRHSSSSSSSKSSGGSYYGSTAKSYSAPSTHYDPDPDPDPCSPGCFSSSRGGDC